MNLIVNQINYGQGKEFVNSLLQKWLDNKDILMYSTHNEDKSIIAKRFMKRLKANIFKKWQLIIVEVLLLIWIAL